MTQTVYIFDVDGVLNDLNSYVPDGRVMDQIAALLERGAHVAINTGRSYPWVEENVVQAIRQRLADSKSLSRLFVATEMGGIGIEFSQGQETKVRSAFSLSPDMIDRVRGIFKANPQYANHFQWYEGKESMATVYKRGKADNAELKQAQRDFSHILKDALKGYQVSVVMSSDAVDVHAPEAGKGAGAQLIHDWLRRTTDIQHDHFTCFGDSTVDYEMARFFAAQSHDSVFVFTGTSTLESVAKDPNVQLVRTEQLYCGGTYQYLRTHVLSLDKT